MRPTDGSDPNPIPSFEKLFHYIHICDYDALSFSLDFFQSRFSPQLLSTTLFRYTSPTYGHNLLNFSIATYNFKAIVRLLGAGALDTPAPFTPPALFESADSQHLTTLSTPNMSKPLVKKSETKSSSLHTSINSLSHQPPSHASGLDIDSMLLTYQPLNLTLSPHPISLLLSIPVPTFLARTLHDDFLHYGMDSIYQQPTDLDPPSSTAQIDQPIFQTTHNLSNPNVYALDMTGQLVRRSDAPQTHPFSSEQSSNTGLDLQTQSQISPPPLQPHTTQNRDCRVSGENNETGSSIDYLADLTANLSPQSSHPASIHTTLTIPSHNTHDLLQQRLAPTRELPLSLTPSSNSSNNSTALHPAHHVHPHHGPNNPDALPPPLLDNPSPLSPCPLEPRTAQPVHPPAFNLPPFSPPSTQLDLDQAPHKPAPKTKTSHHFPPHLRYHAIVLKLLIDHGVDINVPDITTFQSPLYFALSSLSHFLPHHIDMISLLLFYGAEAYILPPPAQIEAINLSHCARADVHGLYKSIISPIEQQLLNPPLNDDDTQYVPITDSKDALTTPDHSTSSPSIPLSSLSTDPNEYLANNSKTSSSLSLEAIPEVQDNIVGTGTATTKRNSLLNDFFDVKMLLQSLPPLPSGVVIEAFQNPSKTATNEIDHPDNTLYTLFPLPNAPASSPQLQPHPSPLSPPEHIPTSTTPQNPPFLPSFLKFLNEHSEIYSGSSNTNNPARLPQQQQQNQQAFDASTIDNNPSALPFFYPYAHRSQRTMLNFATFLESCELEHINQSQTSKPSTPPTSSTSPPTTTIITPTLRSLTSLVWYEAHAEKYGLPSFTTHLTTQFTSHFLSQTDPKSSLQPNTPHLLENSIKSSISTINSAIARLKSLHPTLRPVKSDPLMLILTNPNLVVNVNQDFCIVFYLIYSSIFKNVTSFTNFLIFHDIHSTFMLFQYVMPLLKQSIKSTAFPSTKSLLNSQKSSAPTQRPRRQLATSRDPNTSTIAPTVCELNAGTQQFAQILSHNPRRAFQQLSPHTVTFLRGSLATFAYDILFASMNYSLMAFMTFQVHFDASIKTELLLSLQSFIDHAYQSYHHHLALHGKDGSGSETKANQLPTPPPKASLSNNRLGDSNSRIELALDTIPRKSSSSRSKRNGRSPIHDEMAPTLTSPQDEPDHNRDDDNYQNSTSEHSNSSSASISRSNRTTDQNYFNPYDNTTMSDSQSTESALLDRASIQGYNPCLTDFTTSSSQTNSTLLLRHTANAAVGSNPPTSSRQPGVYNFSHHSQRSQNDSNTTDMSVTESSSQHHPTDPVQPDPHPLTPLYTSAGSHQMGYLNGNLTNVSSRQFYPTPQPTNPPLSHLSSLEQHPSSLTPPVRFPTVQTFQQHMRLESIFLTLHQQYLHWSVTNGNHPHIAKENEFTFFDDSWSPYLLSHAVPQFVLESTRPNLEPNQVEFALERPNFSSAKQSQNSLQPQSFDPHKLLPYNPLPQLSHSSFLTHPTQNSSTQRQPQPQPHSNSSFHSHQPYATLDNHNFNSRPSFLTQYSRCPAQNQLNASFFTGMPANSSQSNHNDSTIPSQPISNPKHSQNLSQQHHLHPPTLIPFLSTKPPAELLAIALKFTPPYCLTPISTTSLLSSTTADPVTPKQRFADVHFFPFSVLSPPQTLSQKIPISAPIRPNDIMSPTIHFHWNAFQSNLAKLAELVSNDAVPATHPTPPCTPERPRVLTESSAKETPRAQTLSLPPNLTPIQISSLFALLMSSKLSTPNLPPKISLNLKTLLTPLHLSPLNHFLIVPQYNHWTGKITSSFSYSTLFSKLFKNPQQPRPACDTISFLERASHASLHSLPLPPLHTPRFIFQPRWIEDVLNPQKSFLVYDVTSMTSCLPSKRLNQRKAVSDNNLYTLPPQRNQHDDKLDALGNLTSRPSEASNRQVQIATEQLHNHQSGRFFDYATYSTYFQPTTQIDMYTFPLGFQTLLDILRNYHEYDINAIHLVRKLFENPTFAQLFHSNSSDPTFLYRFNLPTAPPHATFSSTKNVQTQRLTSTTVASYRTKTGQDKGEKVNQLTPSDFIYSSLDISSSSSVGMSENVLGESNFVKRLFKKNQFKKIGKANTSALNQPDYPLGLKIKSVSVDVFNNKRNLRKKLWKLKQYKLQHDLVKAAKASDIAGQPERYSERIEQKVDVLNFNQVRADEYFMNNEIIGDQLITNLGDFYDFRAPKLFESKQQLTSALSFEQALKFISVDWFCLSIRTMIMPLPVSFVAQQHQARLKEQQARQQPVSAHSPTLFTSQQDYLNITSQLSQTASYTINTFSLSESLKFASLPSHFAPHRNEQALHEQEQQFSSFHRYYSTIYHFLYNLTNFYHSNLTTNVHPPSPPSWLPEIIQFLESNPLPPQTQHSTSSHPATPDLLPKQHPPHTTQSTQPSPTFQPAHPNQLIPPINSNYPAPTFRPLPMIHPHENISHNAFVDNQSYRPRPFSPHSLQLLDLLIQFANQNPSESLPNQHPLVDKDGSSAYHSDKNSQNSQCDIPQSVNRRSSLPTLANRHTNPNKHDKPDKLTEKVHKLDKPQAKKQRPVFILPPVELALFRYSCVFIMLVRSKYIDTALFQHLLDQGIFDYLKNSNIIFHLLPSLLQYMPSESHILKQVLNMLQNTAFFKYFLTLSPIIPSPILGYQYHGCHHNIHRMGVIPFSHVQTYTATKDWILSIQNQNSQQTSSQPQPSEAQTQPSPQNGSNQAGPHRRELQLGHNADQTQFWLNSEALLPSTSFDRCPTQNRSQQQDFRLSINNLAPLMQTTSQPNQASSNLSNPCIFRSTTFPTSSFPIAYPALLPSLSLDNLFAKPQELARGGNMMQKSSTQPSSVPINVAQTALDRTSDDILPTLESSTQASRSSHQNKDKQIVTISMGNYLIDYSILLLALFQYNTMFAFHAVFSSVNKTIMSDSTLGVRAFLSRFLNKTNVAVLSTRRAEINDTLVTPYMRLSNRYSNSSENPHTHPSFPSAFPSSAEIYYTLTSPPLQSTKSLLSDKIQPNLGLTTELNKLNMLLDAVNGINAQPSHHQNGSHLFDNSSLFGNSLFGDDMTQTILQLDPLTSKMNQQTYIVPSKLTFKHFFDTSRVLYGINTTLLDILLFSPTSHHSIINTIDTHPFLIKTRDHYTATKTPFFPGQFIYMHHSNAAQQSYSDLSPLKPNLNQFNVQFQNKLQQPAPQPAPSLSSPPLQSHADHRDSTVAKQNQSRNDLGVSLNLTLGEASPLAPPPQIYSPASNGHHTPSFFRNPTTSSTSSHNSQHAAYLTVPHNPLSSYPLSQPYGEHLFLLLSRSMGTPISPAYLPLIITQPYFLDTCRHLDSTINIYNRAYPVLLQLRVPWILKKVTYYRKIEQLARKFEESKPRSSISLADMTTKHFIDTNTHFSPLSHFRLFSPWFQREPLPTQQHSLHKPHAANDMLKTSPQTSTLQPDGWTLVSHPAIQNPILLNTDPTLGSAHSFISSVCDVPTSIFTIHDFVSSEFNNLLTLNLASSHALFRFTYVLLIVTAYHLHYQIPILTPQFLMTLPNPPFVDFINRVIQGVWEPSENACVKHVPAFILPPLPVPTQILYQVLSPLSVLHATGSALPRLQDAFGAIPFFNMKKYKELLLTKSHHPGASAPLPFSAAFPSQDLQPPSLFDPQLIQIDQTMLQHFAQFSQYLQHQTTNPHLPEISLDFNNVFVHATVPRKNIPSKFQFLLSSLWPFAHPIDFDPTIPLTLPNLINFSNLAHFTLHPGSISNNMLYQNPNIETLNQFLLPKRLHKHSVIEDVFSKNLGNPAEHGCYTVKESTAQIRSKIFTSIWNLNSLGGGAYGPQTQSDSLLFKKNVATVQKLFSDPIQSTIHPHIDLVAELSRFTPSLQPFLLSFMNYKLSIIFQFFTQNLSQFARQLSAKCDHTSPSYIPRRPLPFKPPHADITQINISWLPWFLGLISISPFNSAQVLQPPLPPPASHQSQIKTVPISPTTSIRVDLNKSPTPPTPVSHSTIFMKPVSFEVSTGDSLIPFTKSDDAAIPSTGTSVVQYYQSSSLLNAHSTSQQSVYSRNLRPQNSQSEILHSAVPNTNTSSSGALSTTQLSEVQSTGSSGAPASVSNNLVSKSLKASPQSAQFPQLTFEATNLPHSLSQQYTSLQLSHQQLQTEVHFNPLSPISSHSAATVTQTRSSQPSTNFPSHLPSTPFSSHIYSILFYYILYQLERLMLLHAPTLDPSTPLPFELVSIPVPPHHATATLPLNIEDIEQDTTTSSPTLPSQSSHDSVSFLTLQNLTDFSMPGAPPQVQFGRNPSEQHPHYSPLQEDLASQHSSNIHAGSPRLLELGASSLLSETASNNFPSSFDQESSSSHTKTDPRGFNFADDQTSDQFGGSHVESPHTSQAHSSNHKHVDSTPKPIQYIASFELRPQSPAVSIQSLSVKPILASSISSSLQGGSTQQLPPNSFRMTNSLLYWKSVFHAFLRQYGRDTPFPHPQSLHDSQATTNLNTINTWSHFNMISTHLMTSEGSPAQIQQKTDQYFPYSSPSHFNTLSKFQFSKLAVPQITLPHTQIGTNSTILPELPPNPVLTYPLNIEDIYVHPLMTLVYPVRSQSCAKVTLKPISHLLYHYHPTVKQLINTSFGYPICNSAGTTLSSSSSSSSRNSHSFDKIALIKTLWVHKYQQLHQELVLFTNVQTNVIQNEILVVYFLNLLQIFKQPLVIPSTTSTTESGKAPESPQSLNTFGQQDPDDDLSQLLRFDEHCFVPKSTKSASPTVPQPRQPKLAASEGRNPESLSTNDDTLLSPRTVLGNMTEEFSTASLNQDHFDSPETQSQGAIRSPDVQSHNQHGSPRTKHDRHPSKINEHPEHLTYYDPSGQLRSVDESELTKRAHHEHIKQTQANKLNQLRSQRGNMLSHSAANSFSQLELLTYSSLNPFSGVDMSYSIVLRERFLYFHSLLNTTNEQSLYIFDYLTRQIPSVQLLGYKQLLYTTKYDMFTSSLSNYNLNIMLSNFTQFNAYSYLLFKYLFYTECEPLLNSSIIPTSTNAVQKRFDSAKITNLPKASSAVDPSNPTPVPLDNDDSTPRTDKSQAQNRLHSLLGEQQYLRRYSAFDMYCQETDSDFANFWVSASQNYANYHRVLSSPNYHTFTPLENDRSQAAAQSCADGQAVLLKPTPGSNNGGTITDQAEEKSSPEVDRHVMSRAQSNLRTCNTPNHRSPISSEVNLLQPSPLTQNHPVDDIFHSLFSQQNMTTIAFSADHLLNSAPLLWNITPLPTTDSQYCGISNYPCSSPSYTQHRASARNTNLPVHRESEECHSRPVSQDQDVLSNSRDVRFNFKLNFAPTAAAGREYPWLTSYQNLFLPLTDPLGTLHKLFDFNFPLIGSQTNIIQDPFTSHYELSPHYHPHTAPNAVKSSIHDASIGTHEHFLPFVATVGLSDQHSPPSSNHSANLTNAFGSGTHQDCDRTHVPLSSWEPNSTALRFNFTSTPRPTTSPQASSTALFQPHPQPLQTPNVQPEETKYSLYYATKRTGTVTLHKLATLDYPSTPASTTLSLQNSSSSVKPRPNTTPEPGLPLPALAPLNTIRPPLPIKPRADCPAQRGLQVKGKKEKKDKKDKKRKSIFGDDLSGAKFGQKLCEPIPTSPKIASPRVQHFIDDHNSGGINNNGHRKVGTAPNIDFGGYLGSGSATPPLSETTFDPLQQPSLPSFNLSWQDFQSMKRHSYLLAIPPQLAKVLKQQFPNSAELDHKFRSPKKSLLYLHLHQRRQTSTSPLTRTTQGSHRSTLTLLQKHKPLTSVESLIFTQAHYALAAKQPLTVYTPINPHIGPPLSHQVLNYSHNRHNVYFAAIIYFTLQHIHIPTYVAREFPPLPPPTMNQSGKGCTSPSPQSSPRFPWFLFLNTTPPSAFKPNQRRPLSAQQKSFPETPSKRKSARHQLLSNLDSIYQPHNINQLHNFGTLSPEQLIKTFLHSLPTQSPGAILGFSILLSFFTQYYQFKKAYILSRVEYERYYYPTPLDSVTSSMNPATTSPTPILTVKSSQNNPISSRIQDKTPKSPTVAQPPSQFDTFSPSLITSPDHNLTNYKTSSPPNAQQLPSTPITTLSSLLESLSPFNLCSCTSLNTLFSSWPQLTPFSLSLITLALKHGVYFGDYAIDPHSFSSKFLPLVAPNAHQKRDAMTHQLSFNPTRLFFSNGLTQYIISPLHLTGVISISQANSVLFQSSLRQSTFKTWSAQLEKYRQSLRDPGPFSAPNHGKDSRIDQPKQQFPMLSTSLTAAPPLPRTNTNLSEVMHVINSIDHNLLQSTVNPREGPIVNPVKSQTQVKRVAMRPTSSNQSNPQDCSVNAQQILAKLNTIKISHTQCQLNNSILRSTLFIEDPTEQSRLQLQQFYAEYFTSQKHTNLFISLLYSLLHSHTPITIAHYALFSSLLSIRPLISVPHHHSNLPETSSQHSLCTKYKIDPYRHSPSNISISTLRNILHMFKQQFLMQVQAYFPLQSYITHVNDFFSTPFTTQPPNYNVTAANLQSFHLLAPHGILIDHPMFDTRRIPTSPHPHFDSIQHSLRHATDFNTHPGPLTHSFGSVSTQLNAHHNPSPNSERNVRLQSQNIFSNSKPHFAAPPYPSLFHSSTQQPHPLNSAPSTSQTTHHQLNSYLSQPDSPFQSSPQLVAPTLANVKWSPDIIIERIFDLLFGYLNHHYPTVSPTIFQTDAITPSVQPLLHPTGPSTLSFSAQLQACSVPIHSMFTSNTLLSILSHPNKSIRRAISSTLPLAFNLHKLPQFQPEYMFTPSTTLLPFYTLSKSSHSVESAVDLQRNPTQPHSNSQTPSSHLHSIFTTSPSNLSPQSIPKPLTKVQQAPTRGKLASNKAQPKVSRKTSLPSPHPDTSPTYLGDNAGSNPDDYSLKYIHEISIPAFCVVFERYGQHSQQTCTNIGQFTWDYNDINRSPNKRFLYQMQHPTIFVPHQYHDQLCPFIAALLGTEQTHRSAKQSAISEKPLAMRKPIHPPKTRSHILNPSVNSKPVNFSDLKLLTIPQLYMYSKLYMSTLYQDPTRGILWYVVNNVANPSTIDIAAILLRLNKPANSANPLPGDDAKARLINSTPIPSSSQPIQSILPDISKISPLLETNSQHQNLFAHALLHRWSQDTLLLLLSAFLNTPLSPNDFINSGVFPLDSTHFEEVYNSIYLHHCVHHRSAELNASLGKSPRPANTPQFEPSLSSQNLHKAQTFNHQHFVESLNTQPRVEATVNDSIPSLQLETSPDIPPLGQFPPLSASPISSYARLTSNQHTTTFRSNSIHPSRTNQNLAQTTSASSPSPDLPSLLRPVSFQYSKHNNMTRHSHNQDDSRGAPPTLPNTQLNHSSPFILKDCAHVNQPCCIQARNGIFNGLFWLFAHTDLTGRSILDYLNNSCTFHYAPIVFTYIFQQYVSFHNFCQLFNITFLTVADFNPYIRAPSRNPQLHTASTKHSLPTPKSKSPQVASVCKTAQEFDKIVLDVQSQDQNTSSPWSQIKLGNKLKLDELHAQTRLHSSRFNPILPQLSVKINHAPSSSPTSQRSSLIPSVVMRGPRYNEERSHSNHSPVRHTLYTPSTSLRSFSHRHSQATTPLLQSTLRTKAKVSQSFIHNDTDLIQTTSSFFISPSLQPLE